ncbi:MAG: ATP-grasp domain-containing protein [Planctomycetes bacterium]|nr:ATP-grasp domain-containing protein [Planctomycetota bacterium]
MLEINSESFEFGMRIFLYEWITGGGLVEEHGALPASLLTEGAAMLSALAADFVAIDGAQVTVLRDIRLSDLPLPSCKIVEVHSKSHHREEIERLASKADHTLVIAPEIDDILRQTNRWVRSAGGRLLASSDDFVSLAADKHQTARLLAESGVATPEARLLEADQEKLPKNFPYPGVLKPVHGAGSQHTLLVASERDTPPPYPWPRRLERFCPGMACSVSFLCGPAHRVALPVCRQHLTSDGRFSYTGGSLLGQSDLARRATALADRALEVFPPALGYVGVDLVLGKAADGSEDFVIEINPRLTTSYVGLRAASDDNLAAALLANAGGVSKIPRFGDSLLEFLSDGTIRIPTG